MNSAERFIRCMTYDSPDHVSDLEFGYWDECFVEWPQQGMPQIAPNHRAFELYFGIEQAWGVPFNSYLNPAPEHRVVKIEDGYEFYYDHELVLCKRPADHHSTMPEHLEYSLKDEETWEKTFLPLLDPNDPTRFDPNVGRLADEAAARNEIPNIFVGSLFGTPRNWIGFEQICMMIYTNPALVERVVEQMTEVICTQLDRVLPLIEGKVRWAHFWEDIAFNAGPMISPDYFRQTLTPRYKRITDKLRAHGIDIISVDCDGQVEPLVEAWMEGGLNAMFPLERNGDSDPVRFRKTFGRDLLLMGGVDKTKMAQGGDVIRRELERLAPVVADGGFVPFCDHRVPIDVTLENYRHYRRLKCEIFGIPEKEAKPREDAHDLP